VKGVRLGTKGFSVLFLFIAMLLMITFGYVLSYIIPAKQRSVSSTIQSQQAFFLAQSGVEFAVRYASDNNWTTKTLLNNLNGLTRNLGNGRFALTYNSSNDTLTSVGEVPNGTERRRINVSNFTQFVAKIAFVNATGANSSASSMTIVTPAFAVTAGNTIVVGVSSYTATRRTVSSITDTAGNTYTRCGNREAGDASHDQEVWVAANILGRANNVITVTFSGSADWRYVIAAQYSGLSTASPYDAGSGLIVTANGTTHTTNTSVTTAADELCFGWFVTWDNPYIYSAGSPYTLRWTQGDSCIVDRVVNSVGTYSITANTSSSNRQACLMRTFK